jgi:2-oxoglutarate dehydrogenase E2 component (dihydrolipoamide succinyltransferase)
MAVVEVKLPELGKDAGQEARVSFWYVEKGERVAKDDDLVQMITDKATFDVPSPVDGRVGPITNAAIKVAEEKAGMKPSGRPSQRIYTWLKAN